MKSDFQRHNELTEPVISAAQTFLIEMYGKRCPTYVPDCECCKKWKALDDLTSNPFDEND